MWKQIMRLASLNITCANRRLVRGSLKKRMQHVTRRGV
jgi:hypothetical protein